MSDKLAKEITRALKQGDKQHPKVLLEECIIKDELIYVLGHLYVPDNEEVQREIIHVHHNHPAAGHPERVATYELISRNYWWPNMKKVIARYLSNSDTCARIKPVRNKPYRQLKPLEIPVRRWNSVSMDCIVGLLESNGYNAILVVVDKLSQMAHYIPTSEMVTSEQVARLFFDKVFNHHGIPDSIISDRGTQFTFKFSQALC